MVSHLHACIQSNPLTGLLDEEEEEDDDLLFEEGGNKDIPLPLLELIHILFLWSTIYKVSDNAMTILLKSLKIALGKFVSFELLTKSLSTFPKNVKECISLLQTKGNEQNIKLPDPKAMVVCPKCYSVHDLDWQRNRPTYTKCIHQPSPNHPQRMRRTGCQSELFCNTPMGRAVPEKVFPYIPIELPLKNILSRPGVLDLCSSWRSRVSAESGRDRLLRDIYDGNLLSSYAKRSDLSDCLPLFLALNVDWFQPFTHTKYSVGAMYLSIANLPRDVRFRIENVLLLGVIPGPREPSLHINSFLKSFVEEMLEFFTGVTMIVNGVSVKVRAFLSQVVCDIPGCRKVLALPGHSARLGCSKCLKAFEITSFGDKPNYSGFDRSHWPLRDKVNHTAHALEYAAATTKAEQKRITSEHGVRYCELLELPYFDLIRNHVVDPMHNLFEGSAKRFMELLMLNNLVNMADVEKRVGMVKPPIPTGCIPQKVGAYFSGFSADQWKNWVLFYSAIALYDIDAGLYECWMSFVKACHLLCSRAMTASDVDKADRLLTAFCCGLQAYFGPQSCTVNMHMHLHLRQCLLDYGPIYGFWCFPYERYNGKLGDYATNRKSIEVQVARKFLREHFLRSLPVPHDYRTLLSVNPNTGYDASPHCGLNAITLADYHYINKCQSVVCPVSAPLFGLTDPASLMTLIAVNEGRVLRPDEISGLRCMYSLLYGEDVSTGITFMSHFANWASSVNFAGVTLKKGQIVTAQWPPNDQLLPQQCGIIHGFCVHTIDLDTEGSRQHAIAEVHWHEILDSSPFPKPVLAAKSTVDFRLCHFIPVQRINCICAHAFLSLPQCDNETILITVPLSLNFSIL